MRSSWPRSGGGCRRSRPMRTGRSRSARPSAGRRGSPRTRCGSSPRPRPSPIAQNEVVKSLTDMGYKATDATKDAPRRRPRQRRGRHRRQRAQARSATGPQRRVPDERRHRQADPEGAPRRSASRSAPPRRWPADRAGRGQSTLSGGPAPAARTSEEQPWLRSRSASASRADGPTGSTTSPSCRAAAPATPRTSTSRGRSTPSRSTCRSWRRRWTASSARRPPSRSVGSAASACSTSRASGPATRTPSRCFDEIAELPPRRPPAGCRRSTASRSSPSWSRQRIREIHDAGVVSCASVTPQRTESLAEAPSSTPSSTCSSSRARSCRPSTSRRPQEPLNLKRFVRELDMPVIVGGCASYQAGAAPHAHRRRRRPRRRRSGPGLHHPRRARHRRPPGHRHRRRPRRPHAPPRRDRRLRPRHRRRRHGHRRRHRQGHRLRRRRGDDRLAARRRRRGTRPRLPLGHGHVPPDVAPWGAGRTDARGTLEEILVGPATTTTAGSTSSAPCAPRWPRAATRR